MPLARRGQTAQQEAASLQVLSSKVHSLVGMRDGNGMTAVLPALTTLWSGSVARWHTFGEASLLNSRSHVVGTTEASSPGHCSRGC